VSDTHQPVTNSVQINGRPATYLLVIKQAAASTITVVDEVKARLPGIMAVAPKGLKIALTFDQSVFVKAALWDVLQEAVNRGDAGSNNGAALRGARRAAC